MNASLYRWVLSFVLKISSDCFLFVLLFVLVLVLVIVLVKSLRQISYAFDIFVMEYLFLSILDS